MARARNDAVIAAFAGVLKNARLAAGLTQEQLAGRAQLDRTFIGLLETGNRQPTLSVIVALAYAVDQTPPAFFNSVFRLAEQSQGPPKA